MVLRFYLDPDSGLPHIFNHGVTEEDVAQVLWGPGEDLIGKNDSRIKLGKTESGRYLQVIYVPDDFPDGLFIITAYDLRGKAKEAFRRRQRRRGK